MGILAEAIQAGEGHHAGRARDRIDRVRIESALVIGGLPARRVHVPSDPQIQRQPRAHFPVVLKICAVVIGAGFDNIGRNQCCVVHQTQQHAGDTAAGGAVGEIELASEAGFEIILVPGVAVFESGFEAVPAPDPGEAVDELLGLDRILNSGLVAVRAELRETGHRDGCERVGIDAFESELRILTRVRSGSVIDVLALSM